MMSGQGSTAGTVFALVLLLPVLFHSCLQGLSLGLAAMFVYKEDF